MSVETINHSSKLNFLHLGDTHISPRSAHLSLICIVALGFLLRISMITTPLWIDELTTSWVVSGSFKDIFTRCWINNLSPAYYIIIYISNHIFGNSEISLRLPSVVAGTLLILATYKIALKLIDDPRMALLASFFIAIDKYCIFFSFWARSYALAMLIAAIHIGYFIDLLESRLSIANCYLFGITASLTILLHYTFGTILFFEFVTLIYAIFEHKIHFNGNIIHLLIGIVIIIPLSSPVLKHLHYLYINSHVLGQWIAAPTDLSEMSSLYPQLTTCLLLPYIIVQIFNFKDNSATRVSVSSRDKKRFHFVVLSWIALPTILIWTLGYLRIVNIVRLKYSLWVVPGIFIFIAYFIFSHLQASQRKAFVAIVVILQMSINLYMAKKQLTMFSWKQCVETVNATIESPLPIYVDSHLTEQQWIGKEQFDQQLLKSYLLSGVNSLYKLRDDLLAVSSPIKSFKDLNNVSTDFIAIGVTKETIDNFKSLSAVPLYPRNADIPLCKVTIRKAVSSDDNDTTHRDDTKP